MARQTRHKFSVAYKAKVALEALKRNPQKGVWKSSTIRLDNSKSRMTLK